MVLADIDIRKRLQKDLVIYPINDQDIQPSSVDLHLSNEFLMFDSHAQSLIDPKKGVIDLMRKLIVKKDQPLILHPREFILGSTIETIGVPTDMVGRLDGKSSLGRLGLIIHSTAGYIDPGFRGQITLEISNLANLPIALYPGMRICQISFVAMTCPAQYPYGHKKLKSHYQGQKGVRGSDTKSIWAKK